MSEHPFSYTEWLEQSGLDKYQLIQALVDQQYHRYIQDLYSDYIRRFNKKSGVFPKEYYELSAQWKPR